MGIRVQQLELSGTTFWQNKEMTYFTILSKPTTPQWRPL